MFADINGIQIAYSDEGEGFPLAFIHGFPLSRGAWSKQVEAFKSNYRLITPDLPGFGESESSRGPVTMSRYARGIDALLRHLGTGPVVLVGHSMGGYIALEFARAFPDALRGLVLVSTKSGADSPENALTRQTTAEEVHQNGPSALVNAMAAKMLSANNGDEAMAASVRDLMTSSGSEGIVGALLGMAGRSDASAWIGGIHVPTLVIAGCDDTVIPPSESESLARSIPGAKLKLIPGAGHLLAFEKPDAFNEALRCWLAWGDVSKRSAPSIPPNDLLNAIPLKPENATLESDDSRPGVDPARQGTRITIR